MSSPYYLWRTERKFPTELIWWRRYKLHDWMLEDEGKKWEDRVWAAMAEQVERVKPGSVDWLHVD